MFRSMHEMYMLQCKEYIKNHLSIKDKTNLYYLTSSFLEEIVKLKNISK